jgi:hypothetical protein
MARRLYDGAVSEQRTRRSITVSGALSVAAGVGVLAAFVWQIGPAQIWEGIRRVGWMFPVIVTLGGCRFFVRSCAWSLCAEAPHALAINHAFAGVLAGDAVGNVTPLGPLVGEPAKAAFVRSHLPLQPALTALAIENIFYTLSTATMIVAGTIALLFAFDLPPALREFSEVAVVVILAAVLACLWILWKRPALISRWLPRISRPGTRVHASFERVQALENEIYTFASRRRAAVVPIILLEASFHALGVLETHLTLWMILAAQPLLLDSFILETANRMVAVAFRFVPFQLGVGEVGLAAVTSVLGLGTAPGVALSIVRKARMGVWALIGGTLLLRR